MSFLEADDEDLASYTQTRLHYDEDDEDEPHDIHDVYSIVGIVEQDPQVSSNSAASSTSAVYVASATTAETTHSNAHGLHLNSDPNGQGKEQELPPVVLFDHQVSPVGRKKGLVHTPPPHYGGSGGGHGQNGHVEQQQLQQQPVKRGVRQVEKGLHVRTDSDTILDQFHLHSPERYSTNTSTNGNVNGMHTPSSKYSGGNNMAFIDEDVNDEDAYEDEDGLNSNSVGVIVLPYQSSPLSSSGKPQSQASYGRDLEIMKHYKMAEKLANSRQYEDALRMFKMILKSTSAEIKHAKYIAKLSDNPNRNNGNNIQKLMIYSSTLYNIGILFYKFKLYNEAVPYFQKCAKFSREYLGEYHNMVSASLVKSGRALLQQGRNSQGSEALTQLETSILMLREAARLSKITRGKDSDKTAKCCVYLGYGYAQYGISLHKSNSGRKNKSPASHSRTASVSSEFSKSSRGSQSNVVCGFEPNSKEQRCISKASKYYAESLGIYRGILRRTPDSAHDSSNVLIKRTRLSIAKTLEFIVELQVYLKKWSKAVGSLSEILEIQSFVRGDDHPVTQRTQKLIDALSQKLSKIEAFGSEAFLISDFTYQDANGDDQSRASTKTAELEASPRTAADFMKNAHIFAYQDKNWLESLRCLEKAAKIFQESPSNSPLSTVEQSKLLNNMGVTILFAQNNIPQARNYLEGSLKHLTLTFDGNIENADKIDNISSSHLLIKSQILMNLSHVIMVSISSPNDIDAKETIVDYLNTAVKIKRHIFGANHPSTLAALDTLAQSLTTLKLFADANSTYKQLLKAQKEFYGQHHICVATTNGKLANLYIHLKDYESAMKCLMLVRSYQMIQVQHGEKKKQRGDGNDKITQDEKMLKATNAAIEKIQVLCDQNRVWI